MPRPRHFRGQAKSLEQPPAPLGVHRSPEHGSDPGGDLWPRPKPAIGWGLAERARQRRILRRREEPRASGVPMPPVAEARGAVIAHTAYAIAADREEMVPLISWRRRLPVFRSVGSVNLFGGISKRHENFPICPVDLVDILIGQLDIP
jgi:hypothetical protein